MGYIQDCGKKLDELLAARGASDETRDEIVTVVKRMVLESYHNGLGKKIKEEGEADLPSHKRAASYGRDRRPRPRR
jgi:hypothetical protein